MNSPDLPPAREPAFNIPLAVVVVTLLLAAIQGARSLLDPDTDWRLIAALAFVPARISLWLGHAEMADVLRSAFGDRAARIDMALLPANLRALLDLDGSEPISALSYGLLHGSWGHFLTNGLWLVAFGSPVARRLGAARFGILLAVTTVGGAMAHWWVDPLAVAPLIGASAAVSGATAAAARFVFAPGVRFGELGNDERVRAIPAEPVLRLLSNPRALTFIAFWFLANILFGTGLVSMTGEDTHIAWQAHIGGFVAGLLIFPLLDKGASR